MRIDRSTLEKLELHAAAKSVTATPMDRLPLLPTDRCLSDSAPIVRKVAIAEYSTGGAVASETLTMPRSGFGPRPINIIETPARALYDALADEIRPSLPEETRGREKWTRFSSVGLLEPADTYVVEFDIASCYEYVDHSRLHQEILLHSMNVDAADAIVELLAEIFGRPRGLPQLLAPSDLLSDAYLQGIERALLRAGNDVARYADDFRVLAANWGEANDVIELAADIARDFGLVLSTAKTTIRKSATIRDYRVRLAAFLADYFNAARDDLTIVDIFPNAYGDDKFEIEPTDREAYEAAFWRILEEWRDRGDESELPFHSHHLPLALSYLESARRRVADDMLEQITFAKPVHLQAVLNYVSERPETRENWHTLSTLAAMPRQSPWAKLWLLNSAEMLPSSAGADEAAVLAWAGRQVTERHETVRASAAWVLARRRMLTEGHLRELATAASGISQPLLAAAAAAAELDSKFVRSLKTQSPLAKQAAVWGEGQRT